MNDLQSLAHNTTLYPRCWGLRLLPAACCFAFTAVVLEVDLPSRTQTTLISVALVATVVATVFVDRWYRAHFGSVALPRLGWGRTVPLLVVIVLLVLLGGAIAVDDESQRLASALAAGVFLAAAALFAPTRFVGHTRFTLTFAGVALAGAATIYGLGASGSLFSRGGVTLCLCVALLLLLAGTLDHLQLRRIFASDDGGAA